MHIYCRDTLCNWSRGVCVLCCPILFKIIEYFCWLVHHFGPDSDEFNFEKRINQNVFKTLPEQTWTNYYALQKISCAMCLGSWYSHILFHSNSLVSKYNWVSLPWTPKFWEILTYATAYVILHWGLTVTPRDYPTPNHTSWRKITKHTEIMHMRHAIPNLIYCDDF